MDDGLKGEVTESDKNRGIAVSKWIRGGLAKKGWKNVDLHRASGISPSYIGVLVKGGINNEGKYVNPSEEKIHQISVALGINENDGRKSAGYEVDEVVPHEHLILKTGAVADFFGVPGMTLRITEDVFLRLQTEAQIQQSGTQCDHINLKT